MTDRRDGEIILKEKYGTSNREIFYVRPTAQQNIVILDDNTINVSGWLTKIFLPHGYPDSVSKDYLAYQIWDTAQAFCSTITGILATQEVLRGVGVGDKNATPLAATVTWVFKDGCGHFGKILFAYSHGTHLDAYSKKWRLYADVLNDAAMCMEVALPMFKNYTTFVLCVSTVMKAIVGVAGGATRAALTQHHAIRGNMADVAAKDSAQETFVNLVASVAALMVISTIGNSLLIFALMMVLHIIFNYFAVRAVCLRTLNEPRFLQVIDTYLRDERIATPCEINRNEPIIFYQLGRTLLDLKQCGFRMKLGCSIKLVIEQTRAASHLKSAIDIYSHRNYLLFPNISTREMYVALRYNATIDDMLRAYFHGVLIAIVTCAINNDNLSIFRSVRNPKPYTKLCQTLQNSDWGRAPSKENGISYSGFVYNPSVELLTALDQIFEQEWARLKERLEHSGWDLSKHLLIIDEWRWCTDTIDEHVISPDNVKNSTDSLKNPVTFQHFFGEASSDVIDTNTIEPDTKVQ